MNILLIHQHFPGQFRYLAPALVKRGHNVVALGLRAPEQAKLSGLNYVQYSLDSGNTQNQHPWLLDFESKVIRGIGCVKEAFQLKQQGFEPDVILVHPGWGESLFLKEVWSKPKILIYCEFFYSSHGLDVGFDSEFYKNDLMNSCRVNLKNTNYILHMQFADGGISPTHWQRSTFPDSFRDKISVIHDGVDSNLIKPDRNASITINGNIKLTSKEKVITFVNRNLEPLRGFHVFMRALPEILKSEPETRVLIIGNDSEGYAVAHNSGKSWRSILLEELHSTMDSTCWERVHFLGTVPYEHYLSVLRVSTVHIYFTYPFVLSWSLLEAMSTGCAIIGSKTGPVEEVIDDGRSGLLSDFFDHKLLAEKALYLLKNKKIRDELGRNARETIQKNYDLQTCCLPKQIEWVESMSVRSQIQYDNEQMAISSTRNLLATAPGHIEARRILINEAAQRPIEEPSKFVARWLKGAPNAYSNTIQQATKGWAYLTTIDGKFLLSKDVHTTSSESLGAQCYDRFSGPGSDTRTVEDNLLMELARITDLRERWNYAMQTSKDVGHVLYQDSFFDIGDNDLEGTLVSEFSDTGLNIVVLGGGPAGLAFSNSLKIALGEKVNILVIDNRTSASHRRQAYTRHWLTHLPVSLVRGVIDPRVVDLLSEFGQEGFLGTTVGLLELLLLASNKDLGIKFLYDSEYSLDFLKKARATLVVDATGRRLASAEQESQKDETKSFEVNIPAGSYDSFRQFGVECTNSEFSFHVNLEFAGGYAYPKIKDKPVLSSMFKITKVPLGLYRELLELVESFQSKNLVYIWPGKLLPDINEILLIINLDYKGFNFLNSELDRPEKLSAFLTKNQGKLDSLDTGIVDLLFYLSDRIDPNEETTIEPPYIYRPYVRNPNQLFSSIDGVPLIRIGDSVFNGNPKVGNGLGQHLTSILKLVDEALLALAIEPVAHGNP